MHLSPVPSEPPVCHHTLIQVIFLNHTARRELTPDPLHSQNPRAMWAPPSEVHILRQQSFWLSPVSVSHSHVGPGFPKPLGPKRGETVDPRIPEALSTRVISVSHKTLCSSLGSELPELLKAMAFLGTKPSAGSSLRLKHHTHHVQGYLEPSSPSSCPQTSSWVSVMDWHVNKFC